MGQLDLSEKSVLKRCLSSLEMWKKKGVVIHYERRITTTWADGRHIKLAEAGTPDITAYVKKDKFCHVFFFEVKSQKISVIGPNQIKFMNKFHGQENIHCYIVNTHKDIDRLIDDLTSYSMVKLGSFNVA